MAKQEFLFHLRDCVGNLAERLAHNDRWTIRGLIDGYGNVFPLSTDTKVISSVFELQLYFFLLKAMSVRGYFVEPALRQNWYPDLTFISMEHPDAKFAVDVKSTYRDEKYPDFCNGFTLGSHGKYFTNRASRKNIQYPYEEYLGHFCIGVIYSRLVAQEMDAMRISVLKDGEYIGEQLATIPPLIGQFRFFVQEKWRIASDRQGSGNTANIGSVKYIPDLVNGNGVFAKANESLFDDYWIHFQNGIILGDKRYQYASLREYLQIRGMPETYYNPRMTKEGRR